MVGVLPPSRTRRRWRRRTSLDRLINLAQAAFAQLGDGYGLAEGGRRMGVGYSRHLRHRPARGAPYVNQLVRRQQRRPRLADCDGWVTYRCRTARRPSTSTASRCSSRSTRSSFRSYRPLRHRRPRPYARRPGERDRLRADEGPMQASTSPTSPSTRPRASAAAVPGRSRRRASSRPTGARPCSSRSATSSCAPGSGSAALRAAAGATATRSSATRSSSAPTCSRAGSRWPGRRRTTG